jgi:hypothetical protein
MKKLIVIVLFLRYSPCFGQHQFIDAGIDYRQFPIDIEDVPRGPSLQSNGGFYSWDFWTAFSLNVRYGIETKKYWSIALSWYIRYNHLCWTKGRNFSYSIFEPNPPGKKVFKYDILLEAEKRFRVGKKKTNTINVLAGAGWVNLNTRYNVVLRDTFLTYLGPIKHYSGNVARFAPKFSIGYQYKRIRTSIDGYIIEGHDLNGLTALWVGWSLAYEFRLHARKRVKQN